MSKLIDTKPTGPVTLDNFLSQLNNTMARMENDQEYNRAVLEGHPEGNPVMLGPRVVSATDWVDKQQSGAINRADAWLKNSLAPKKDPKSAALKAAGKYKTNMQAALAAGSFEKGIAGYDEAARTAVITEGGTTAFTSGVTRHKAKAVSKIGKLQPMVAALATTLDGMPIDTDAQREAKMLAAKRGMQEIGKKMRGG